MSPAPPWRPGRWEQHLLWVSRLIFRWVGVCGCVYEAIKQNSVGMVAFAVAGTGMDAGRVLSVALRALLDESRDVREEAERETISQDSSLD